MPSINTPKSSVAPTTFMLVAGRSDTLLACPVVCRLYREEAVLVETRRRGLEKATSASI